MFVLGTLFRILSFSVNNRKLLTYFYTYFQKVLGHLRSFEDLWLKEFINIIYYFSCLLRKQYISSNEILELFCSSFEAFLLRLKKIRRRLSEEFSRPKKESMGVFKQQEIT